MHCMKCGRETADGQAYCDLCLEEMELFPVRPGTVILLPREEPAPVKKPVTKKKSALSNDDLVPILKRKVWTLRLLALALTLLLSAISVIAVQAVTELDWQRLLGKNYNTVTQATEPPASPN